MEELKVIKNNALKAYNDTDEKGKKLLVNLFGDKVFSQKITDRVKTFEDSCNVLGIEHVVKVDTIGLPKDEISIIAYAKLIIIARALNEGWTPDWGNRNQYKYFPWFEMNQAGSGFSRSYYDNWYSDAGVGSRLCYKSEELASYAGKQFQDIYEDFLTIKQ